MITDKDNKILLAQDDKTLAEWACMLNRWEWPKEIPNPELPKDWISSGRRSQLRNWIEDKVGHKLVSRTWNKDSMTDEEHEDFWKGCFEGDIEAKLRYEKSLWERSKEASE